MIPFRTAFAPPDPASTRDQLRIVAGLLRDRYPAVSDLPLGAEADVTCLRRAPPSGLEEGLVYQSLERLIREIKRRADAIGIYDASHRIVLAEQHDEWHVTHRRDPREESMALFHTTSQDQTHKSMNQHQPPAAGRHRRHR